MLLRVDPKKNPVVALESTVISHGLPWPENFETAIEMEDIVKNHGAVPATIGIVNGEITVGLNKKEIEEFSKTKPFKTGVREIPFVTAKKLNGDTTVSATMRIAKIAGIDVFVTGGIGGVHKGNIDISQDLVELSRTRMIVVSAGAKSILDLNATVELLETLGVLVVGYKTDEFPAFYTRESGIRLNMHAESIVEVVEIYTKMIEIGYEGALLLVNPIPEEFEIPFEIFEKWYKEAEKTALKKGITGKEVTPFLLSEIAKLSEGKTLKANIELLKNNAQLGAKVAKKLFEKING